MLIKTFIIIFLALVSHIVSAAQPFAIAIHGGAGTILKSSMTPELEAQYRKKLDDAKQLGYSILSSGGTSEQAVLSVIKILEDSPLFNAGIGAVYTYEGQHELDASVMDGKSRMAGAITGVKTVRHPIELASAVMHKSVHVMLSGSGAENFATTVGLEQIDNSIFNTKRRFESLQRAKAKMKASANWLKNEDFRYGTVGAVALDKFGNLFAGTSTGGMTAKRWGRIGDSPIIGAGTFADNKSCAVSATGHGEFFIRFNVASDICARVAYQGKSIKQAGDEVIFDVLEPVGGTGGVIIIDTKGNIHMPFNTAGMYRAARSNNGVDKVLIYREE
ncbi:isoaspartyl peptidase/L-asparaginase family protein [Psychrosphaera algicola]|uniref:Isoaspartyl peptidase/L-asparaginase n=1 Tax=Psychrosphaera algicola TaxID=3023714 RepID=A0ABT5F976_9GAMM|nr:isoaspartyl peptidase/L-asparaginase [Psychrosphaera sp. G1-22]MDC2888083.1 isoaspartyl peptidase/L-asparaginase [Psychrosphaera sp. G1-22]